MFALILLALVGLVAQLVDGTLGMGYGVTSSSLLLAVGLSPALASASVHLSQIGTTLMSGVSHLRLGNTDRALVARLAVPGAVGAFLGATVLSRLTTAAATPVTATILLVLGVYVLVRFAVRPSTGAAARTSPHTLRLLAPLGLIGGFIDATGGGGWGPVVTTTLLSRGRTAPRTVVGSVDTAEFIVSVTASLGFLLGLGTAGIDVGIVIALLGGGVLAAPLAAWAVSRMPGATLGTAVGGLIVVTNTVTVLEALGLSAPATAWTVSALVAALLPLIAFTVRRARHLTVIPEVQAA
ncbi:MULTISPECIES: sulfite exporter TauE/SafE family protein [unclassified Actinomyces]|uniref:sulfite exporter TauE/SafE family protein n=1 Tax=unclassified Actinomyces TaxID=2609248 RepID=UPI0013A6E2D0|nr:MULTISPECIES: sulfite exporter TauE/SafE family protein [unclassified Actinomyces]MBW3069357.1 sulfite exporter TauE/SafE family protein [Actinomyces sp. 594]NDR53764.1 sulfite exporter TauE/SafE family protein [Actinomyces sp. 565]